LAQGKLSGVGFSCALFERIISRRVVKWPRFYFQIAYRGVVKLRAKLLRVRVYLQLKEERMTDTAEIITRLRCQHIDIARDAADTIERLSASEADARQALSRVQTKYNALLMQRQRRRRKISQAG
jgi:hypothetical protein